MGANPPLLADSKDTILVIIDVQERLAPVVRDKDALIENVQRLVKFSLLAEIPVVVTEQQKLGQTVPEIMDLMPSITPITKLTFDCFKSPEFCDLVSRLNRKTLIITGIEAHICVLQTALHGLESYNVHVIADAIGSRSLHNKEIALRRMEKAGVTLSSTETAIYELMERAGTELFKKVLPLVK